MKTVVSMSASMRIGWICLFALLSCFSSLSAQQPIETAYLSSIPNFRDIAGISGSMGGSGFVNPTTYSGVMRTGVFYRSCQLDGLLGSSTNLATFSALHIGRVIDLRTPDEISGGPDPGAQMLGVSSTININIYSTNYPMSSGSYSDPTPIVTGSMRNIYRQFVENHNECSAFGQVLIQLANDSTPDLYHCSGGKDRTGWTSVLLQSIAGVSGSNIMQDYLATNKYTADFMTALSAHIMQTNSNAILLTVQAMLGVDKTYLQAALDQVIADYGSMDAYLKQGLHLTQADIYVLRAKMVYYPVLPGQSGLVGNAASGAAFLNALQNSSLSGHYTNYNYYLQSAIDAGSLGGVETQAGGQVYADAISYLLRQPQQIDEALAPYTNGRDLRNAETHYWIASFGGAFWTNAQNGIANSSETSAGSIVGATYRLNDQVCANLGLGYNWGSVASANATDTLNTALFTTGGRYAFSNLESGPFIDAYAEAGWVNSQSSRGIGGNLGAASGKSNGAVYSGRVCIGDLIRFAPLTVSLQTGMRVDGVALSGFNENGSDLALCMNSVNQTASSFLVNLDLILNHQQLKSWTFEPALHLGYERILNNPQVQSTGTLDGFSVNQYSAYTSPDVITVGLGVTAQHDVFTLTAQVNEVSGGAKSIGIRGQLSVGYSF